jgi:GntR family transcriptional regulator / MocR family aminotransferase
LAPSETQRIQEWTYRKGPFTVLFLYHFSGKTPMPKRATAFELMLPQKERGTPAYRWLYAVLRGEILEARLHRGARLPATRDLARQYGLSRGTVVSAFEQLKSEGYLQGSVGSGTYVSKVLPDELFRAVREGGPNASARTKQRRRVSDYGKRVNLFPTFALRPSRAFRANLPALDLFPTTLWAQITNRRLRRASTNFLLGADPRGYRPLREAVAEYLNTSRGVKCVPEQVAVVSGVQEALDLAARLFLNPGDRVCMEDPGYVGAARVFEAMGAKICAVRLDDEGLEFSEDRLRGCRLVYVTQVISFRLESL